MQDGHAVSDKRMKLGLEWIISVTSSTIIPHTGAKVSIDFCKSAKSAIGSCKIPKNSQISDFGKTATSSGCGMDHI